MKPLTLALVRQRYTPDGGAERFLSRTLAALHEQGVRIVLATRQWQAGESMQLLICNPFYIGSLWRDWSFAGRVCALLKKHPVDLVQSHERIVCCDIYRAGDGVHREWLKQRRRTLGPGGRLRLCLNPYHYYVLWAEKRLFNSTRLRAVICNSRMVKEEIKQYFKVPEDKLRIIYSGIDAAMFHPSLRSHRVAVRDQYAIPHDAALFLFVGSGFERKGVSMLLSAMVELPDHTHLLIVGRDKNSADFLAQAQALGLTRRVHFAGPQQDVRPYYGAADVFVLPTLYDPFPNVILEAMAAGLPVITSTKCGAAEIIIKNNCGFICDALNKHQLVIHMRNMLDADRRGQFSVAARSLAETMDYEPMSRQLLGLYQSLIDTK